ncbi:MAG: AI-2E family transporter [Gemmataceae bacterium]
MPTEPRSSPYRPLIVCGVLISLAAVLGIASKIFIPIALGILLTFILTPAVAFLQSRGLRRVYAVVLVVFTTAAAVGGLASALAVQLRDLAVDLPRHKGRIREKLQVFVHKGPGVVENLTAMLDDLSAEVQGDKDEAKKAPPLPVRLQPDRPTGVGLLSLIAGPLAGTLGSVSLTIALTVSMLVMREDLRNRLFLLLGDGHLTSTTRALDEVSKRISRYLVTQVALNAAFGTLFGLGLWVMGVNYALVWGVLAAFLRFVPYVGTWMAAFFPVLVSLATFDGWLRPIGVIGYVVFLGVLANNILEPMLVSRTTGVTPIALVIATAFWTFLWGPIGLILSTPITVCLSVLGKYVPSLRFLDVLLGTAAPLEPELKFYQRLIAHDEIEAGDLLEEYLLTHPPEELFDAVVIPALSRARLDHERGNLREDELQALVRTARELLDAALGEAGQGEDGVVLMACPAHDAVDALALELLGRAVAGKARVSLVSPEATAAEVVALAEEAEPVVVCVVGLPPAGSARARYLCKKLRARLPQLPVIVGMWGTGGDEALATQLRAAGATHVAATLAEIRVQVVPLLQVARHLEPA